LFADFCLHKQQHGGRQKSDERHHRDQQLRSQTP
jgi:hypothetical protein